MNQKDQLSKLPKTQEQIDKIEFNLEMERTKLMAIVKGGNPENDRLIEEVEGAITIIQRTLAAHKQKFNNELLLTQPYYTESPVHPVFHDTLKSFGIL